MLLRAFWSILAVCLLCGFTTLPNGDVVLSQEEVVALTKHVNKQTKRIEQLQITQKDLLKKLQEKPRKNCL